MMMATSNTVQDNSKKVVRGDDKNRFSYATNEDLSNCMLNVRISNVSTAKNITTYSLTVQSKVGQQKSWIVDRRYSDFLSLNTRLRSYFSDQSSTALCPGCHSFASALSTFNFPKKHLFAASSPSVIKSRARSLQNFIRLVAAKTFTRSPKCPTCSGASFEMAKTFLTQDKIINEVRPSDVIKTVADRNTLYDASVFQPKTNAACSSITSTNATNSITTTASATSSNDQHHAKVAPVPIKSPKRKRDDDTTKKIVAPVLKKLNSSSLSGDEEELNLEFSNIAVVKKKSNVKNSDALMWQPWELSNE